jgi:hypothetical protein
MGDLGGGHYTATCLGVVNLAESKKAPPDVVPSNDMVSSDSLLVTDSTELASALLEEILASPTETSVEKDSGTEISIPTDQPQVPSDGAVGLVSETPTTLNVTENPSPSDNGPQTEGLAVEFGPEQPRKWWKLNDSWASELKDSEVVSSNAYLLFYRRCERVQEQDEKLRKLVASLLDDPPPLLPTPPAPEYAPKPETETIRSPYFDKTEKREKNLNSKGWQPRRDKSMKRRREEEFLPFSKRFKHGPRAPSTRRQVIDTTMESPHDSEPVLDTSLYRCQFCDKNNGDFDELFAHMLEAHPEAGEMMGLA